MNVRFLNNRAGWTLVEMMIGILILGVILAILTPKFRDLGARGKYARVAADIRVMIGAFGSQFTDQNAYADDAMPGEMPAALSQYLAEWPQPPCPGWTYDWENIVNVNFEGFARITVRNQEDKAIFYRCVNVYGNSSACEDPGDFIYGGQDISLLPTRLVRCTET